MRIAKSMERRRAIESWFRAYWTHVLLVLYVLFALYHITHLDMLGPDGSIRTEFMIQCMSWLGGLLAAIFVRKHI